MSFAGAEQMRPTGVEVVEVDLSDRIPNRNGTVYTMDMDIASMYPATGIDAANRNPSFSVSSRGRLQDDGAVEWMEWSMVNPCAEISLKYDRGLCQLGREVDHFKDEEDLFEI